MKKEMRRLGHGVLYFAPTKTTLNSSTLGLSETIAPTHFPDTNEMAGQQQYILITHGSEIENTPQPQPVLQRRTIVHKRSHSSSLIEHPRKQQIYETDEAGTSKAIKDEEAFSTDTEASSLGIIPPTEGRENEDNRSLHQKLARLENKVDQMMKEMKKLTAVVTEAVATMKSPRSVVSKPNCLPICDLEALEEYDAAPDPIHDNVIAYFQSIGGFTLREAVTLCLREAIVDDVLATTTWFGKAGKTSLCKKKIVDDIFAGVCRNKSFPTPTRMAFELTIKSAIRTAQERVRHRAKKASLQEIGHHSF